MWNHKLKKEVKHKQDKAIEVDGLSKVEVGGNIRRKHHSEGLSKTENHRDHERVASQMGWVVEDQVVRVDGAAGKDEQKSYIPLLFLALDDELQIIEHQLESLPKSDLAVFNGTQFLLDVGVDSDHRLAVRWLIKQLLVNEDLTDVVHVGLLRNTERRSIEPSYVVYDFLCARTVLVFGEQVAGRLWNKDDVDYWSHHTYPEHSYIVGVSVLCHKHEEKTGKWVHTWIKALNKAENCVHLLSDHHLLCMLVS